MDEYDQKFAEMQKYIPFLEAMIERLQNVVRDTRDTRDNREIQLQKMKGLHGYLTNSRPKYVENCDKMNQKFIQKLRYLIIIYIQQYEFRLYSL